MKNSKYHIILVILVIFIFGVGFLLPNFNTYASQDGDKEIQALSKDIKDKQNDIEELRQKIDAYQQNLDKERTKANSLKNQIYILETQISKKEAEIKLNEDEIDKTNLEVQRTEEEIKGTEEGIVDRKDEIAEFLRELYRQDQKNDLEIVIMNESISDFFNQIQVAAQVQSKINDNLIDLKEMRIELKDRKEKLNNKKEVLNNLKNKLEGSRGGLEDQQYTKQYILNQTRNSESRYKKMVQELKLEQKKINSEIVTLEKVIRAKLSGGSTKLSDLGDVALIWPVPSRHITTYFHDPDYPFRYIYEHPAIDVRAKQGTPLRAAASGYVAKVKDGGRYGFSYIMLIHNNGLSTVYAHVSEIYVKPDQFITQGEVIGASGGTPGTRGAGRLTTGPHLHFEVRKDGIPVNPLDYLP